jgi:hypothetical protein
MSKPNTCNGQCLINHGPSCNEKGVWVTAEDVDCEFKCVLVDCPVCFTGNPLFILLSSVEGCSGCGIVKYPKQLHEKLVPNTCKGLCLRYIEGKYIRFMECEYKCLPVKCLGCEKKAPECIVDIHSGFCYECFSEKQGGGGGEAEEKLPPYTATLFEQVPEYVGHAKASFSGMKEMPKMPASYPKQQKVSDNPFAESKDRHHKELYKHIEKLPFGKHKGKTLKEISLIAPDYVMWLTGYKLVDEKKVKFSSPALNTTRKIHAVYVKMAEDFLQTKCWHCFKELVPFTTIKDWSGRYLHKKCWSLLASK